MRLTYTLLADGTSDRALMHIIDWALRRRSVAIEKKTWADLSLIPLPGKGLADRVEAAMRWYPADLFFIHRDAEKETVEARWAEIEVATAGMALTWVPVVPVRMTEAWLLHDEGAVRMAANNPRGRDALALPGVRTVESLPDPKATLFAALMTASGFTGRRRERLKRDLPRCRALVAERIDDFSPLLGLPAFDQFLARLDAALDARAAP
ncbi:MAG: hypothetical protein H6706_00075 [Myxococcales bacterium]|nr:hypothetical protein [Myxococcales bacterium]